MNIAHSFNDLVGNTPIIELHNIEKQLNLKAHLLAKLEYFNPGGSAKDRVAKEMILDAKEKGLLKEGATIIEPTSGNTGIGICAVCASLGYKAIIVMPDSMSEERKTLMKAYGAELVLTPGALGMKGAIEKAEELHKEIDNSMIAGQFENPNNPKAHFLTTGPEIYKQLDGKIDIFVAGIGTGGTITGVGEYLKSKNPHIQIIGVEPADSPLLTQGIAGSHKIQGIGANFIPEVLNMNIYDKLYTITTEDAYNAVKLLSYNEGILAGISSGGALHVAIELAKLKENANKNIVAFLPDGGDRYLSTDLFK